MTQMFSIFYCLVSLLHHQNASTLSETGKCSQKFHYNLNFILLLRGDFPFLLFSIYINGMRFSFFRCSREWEIEFAQMIL